MARSYNLKLVLIIAVLAASTIGAEWAGITHLPLYTWLGLAYLSALTWLIHKFVTAASDNPNSVIRRLMIASIMRMILGLLFLVITLFNVQPMNLHFVIFYCVYFCVFMVFEISQMRANLRPDSKQRPKNENA